MDLVLGLSITAKVVRWVLVEGVTGEGAPVDRGALDISDVDAFDAEALLESLLTGGDVHAVGLTWSQDAEAAAVKVRAALDLLGGGAYVVGVSDAGATELLASGIADLAGYDFLVVCIVEPDAVVVATVNSGRVSVTRVDRADAATVNDRVADVVRRARPSPDAIFVLGSDDADELMSTLRDAMDRPVFTATESDVALARGAALASARALDASDEPVAKPRISQVRVLSSVLAAAVVVFVVSVSLAVGLRLTPASEQPARNTNNVEQIVRPAAPPPTAEAAPAPLPAAPPPAPEAAPVAEPAPEPPAAAPVEPAPVYEPPAPESVYVPPPPPAYVPPVIAPQPPRLRDRIIEKIPLLNRFH